MNTNPNPDQMKGHIFPDCAMSHRVRHPFLRDVDAVLSRQGGRICHVSSQDGVKSVMWEWGGEFPIGYLTRGVLENDWARTGHPGSHGLYVTATSTGGFAFEDGYPILSTTLRDSGDVSELIDFFIRARLDDIGNSLSKRTSLAMVIEKVFYAFGRGPDQKIRMVPLDGRKMPKEAPDIRDFMKQDGENSFFSPEELYLPELNRFLSSEFRLGRDLDFTTLDAGDLILSSGGIVKDHEVFPDREDVFYHSLPIIVIRLKNNLSRMWFGDFLELAKEADGLLDYLVREWNAMPGALNHKEIHVPARKEAQISRAVVLRQARRDYRESVQQLSSIREPLGETASLYRKRAKAVRTIYGESLEDIEALQSPLPFFLEYPYRHFRREDDHIQKVRAGQRLLGILAKVPLFLVVEELLAGGHELGAAILEKLEERAPSDGTLVGMQKLVAAKIGELDDNPLVMFHGLAETMSDVQDLESMVTARNRMHHEPYDEVGFLNMMKERAPKVMDRLRGTLHDCRFIVPQHGRMLDGKRVITAEDACSADAHFRTIDLKVSLPLEQFPSGELMVWRSDPEHALKLGKLLTSKLVTRQSRDFGIFDRMQKNERHFTFLRSD